MRSWLRRGLVAAALVTLSVVPPMATAQTPLDCTIERAHARVWSQVNEGGQVVYYGAAIMYTRDCGDLSPGDISVTFRPVSGAVSTCDPRGSMHSDEAVCTSGLGAAVQGTQIEVTATGKSFGVGGAGAFISSCTVILPAWDNASCSFPIRLTS